MTCNQVIFMIADLWPRQIFASILSSSNMLQFDLENIMLMLLGKWLSKYIKQQKLEYIIYSIYEDLINAVTLFLLGGYCTS